MKLHPYTFRKTCICKRNMIKALPFSIEEMIFHMPFSQKIYFFQTITAMVAALSQTIK